MLLEDAFVLRDHRALAHLFEAGGMLVVGGGPRQAPVPRFEVWKRPSTGRPSSAETATKYTSPMTKQPDRWAAWLLEHRDGGDPRVLERLLPELHRFRDTVLDNASIADGDVVLDVGTGTGLIGFGALERVGPGGRVIFSDVSADLLDQCHRLATTLGALDRCGFLLGSADNLRGLTDGSVDVVTTRSVLIYLEDKQPAFHELFRVLKPGGRLSIFEPINRFGCPPPDHLYRGFDVSPVLELARKLQDRELPPEQHPLVNFDERDLLRFAEQAGFCPIRLEYSATISVAQAANTNDWETFKRMSGNPLDPTLEEAMDAALTEQERRRFEAHLRPLVEHGAQGVQRKASVFLSATKPPTS
jgi:ubiquinone/menaquinone biosynthesis C-methylase UbiE